MTACHAEDEYRQGTSLIRPRDSCFIFFRQDSGTPCRRGKGLFYSVRYGSAQAAGPYRSSCRKQVKFNC